VSEVLSLGEVVRPNRPRVKPESMPNAPFIGMEHVEAHTMKLLGTVPAATMKSSAVHFKSGDVLYGRLRPYLNKVFRPTFEGLCSAEFIVLPENERIDGRYLQYFLNSGAFVRFATHLNAGDRPRVDFDQIAPYKIPVPSIARQHEIVAELEKQFSRLDEAVANLQRVKANLKRYKASVLKAAVEGRLVETEATLARREGRTYETGEQLLQRILAERRAKWSGKGKYKDPLNHASEELPDAPEGWGWCSLDVVAEETLLGLDRGRDQQRAEPVGVRYVKMNNVTMDGDVQTDELVYVDANQEEVVRYELANGDLLFNTRNSLELVGKVGIVRSMPIGTVFNNNLMRIRTCGGVSSVFLGYQMCAPDFRQRMEKVKKATTSVAAVYQKDLLPLPIALPPIGEQARIVAEVDRHLSIIREVEAEVDANLQRAQALRQATLAKAFLTVGG